MAESAKAKVAGAEVEIAVEEETRRPRRQGLERLARSALRAGVNLALIPVALLPDPSQKHIRRAGSEFALGVAALLRSTSETLDKVADEI